MKFVGIKMRRGELKEWAKDVLPRNMKFFIHPGTHGNKYVCTIIMGPSDHRNNIVLKIDKMFHRHQFTNLIQDAIAEQTSMDENSWDNQQRYRKQYRKPYVDE